MLATGREFAEICADTLELADPVYEFGSLLVPDQPVDGDLRPFFPGREFVGADMRPGPGVDRLLDLHGLDLPDQSVGTALLFDTLEHVERPWVAIEELHRVLRADGTLVMSVPFNFVIHSYPNDYWRFTPEGVRSLLSGFVEVLIEPVGLPDDPDTVLAVASKSPRPPSEWEALRGRLEPRVTLWNAIVEKWPR